VSRFHGLPVEAMQRLAEVLEEPRKFARQGSTAAD